MNSKEAPQNTKEAHTPGPWRVSVDIQPGRPDRYLVRDSRNLAVCEVFGLDERADARLMAAAPCLLEALRVAEQSFAARCAFGDADLCRAAIAKATGGAA